MPADLPTPGFTAWVSDAGGGMVELTVDRDTMQYPGVGSRVLVLVIEEEGTVLGETRPPWWYRAWRAMRWLGLVD